MMGERLGSRPGRFKLEDTTRGGDYEARWTCQTV